MIITYCRLKNKTIENKKILTVKHTLNTMTHSAYYSFPMSIVNVVSSKIDIWREISVRQTSLCMLGGTIIVQCCFDILINREETAAHESNTRPLNKPFHSRHFVRKGTGVTTYISDGSVPLW